MKEKQGSCRTSQQQLVKINPYMILSFPLSSSELEKLWVDPISNHKWTEFIQQQNIYIYYIGREEGRSQYQSCMHGSCIFGFYLLQLATSNHIMFSLIFLFLFCFLLLYDSHLELRVHPFFLLITPLFQYKYKFSLPII